MVGVVPYAVAAFSALVCGCLALWRLNKRSEYLWLLLPLFGTSAFCAVVVWLAFQGGVSLTWLLWGDALRSLLWVLALLSFFSPNHSLLAWHDWSASVRALASAALLSLVVMSALLGVSQFRVLSVAYNQVFLIAAVALVLVGVLLIEQIFRNSQANKRWAIKFLCVSVGAMFGFSFYMHTNALLFGRVDGFLWAAQGLVLVFVPPLYLVSLLRLRSGLAKFALSRRMVFYSASLMLGGVYLLVLALGGYYVRLYGGEWGRVVQAVLFFGGAVGLVFLISSGHTRAYLRVFLSKHFFSSRYDYRDEWARFTKILSDSSHNLSVKQKVIEALAVTVEAPAGVLWLRNDAGNYDFSAQWNMHVPEFNVESGVFSEWLKETQWVVELGKTDVDVALPSELSGVIGAWLLIPLLVESELMGFVVLRQPLAARDVDWEDRDLLKVIASQAAVYLSQSMMSQALTEAQQFEAYNRMSAFVVHDLKNVVAQLSLLLSNAEKHKSNPAFIEDAFSTVGSAVDRMNKTLGQLRQRMQKASVRPVDLGVVLERVIVARSERPPMPEFSKSDTVPVVVADEEQLANVFNHLVQNAQEACHDGGKVIVTLNTLDDNAMVSIRDTGVGMDEHFLREKLFAPFATTKGNAGMGIGAYQARSIVKSFGGRIEVSSEVGRGTEFRVFLPLSDQASL